MGEGTLKSVFEDLYWSAFKNNLREELLSMICLQTFLLVKLGKSQAKRNRMIAAAM